MRRGGVALLVVIVGALATAPTSASAAGWLAPTGTAPASYEVDDQDLELDAQGNAAAAWTVYGPQWRHTQVATRPRGGSWSAPHTFSPPNEEGGWNPEVAVGANGDAVAVWVSVHPDHATAHISASVREAGGDWSQPVRLSEGGLELTYQPEVAVDPQGNMTAIWSEADENVYSIKVSTRSKGGEWSEPISVSTSEVRVFDDPQLAVDAAGEVTAVWNSRLFEYTGGIIQSATLAPGGEWSEPVDISDEAQPALHPQLALTGDGEAVLVWTDREFSDFPGSEDKLQAARRSAGTWTEPVDLTDDPIANSPEVAIDPLGTATAVWESFDSVGTTIYSSTGEEGEPWSQPVAISGRDESPEYGSDPNVVADSDGNVAAIWHSYYDFGINLIEGVRREIGGDWSQPVEIGRSNGAIEAHPLAVDPDGYVTVAWSRGSRVFSAVFDRIAPELNDVTVPTTAIVGQPVAMSADPFDVWPPVATAWDFGDGGAGSGASVEHCYSTLGERTVTITGTDGAANTASASRAITIEPDPGLAAGVDPCAEPEPPDPPQLTGTDPPSPALSGTPRILGVAEAGLTVHVYAGSTCSGLPVATGSAAELGSPGVSVQVAEGITAVFSATATDLSANTSDCSGSISYTRLKAPTDSGGGGEGDGPTDEDKGPNPSPGCVVPRLAGKTLVRAKAALKAAACRLGTVRKPRPRQGRRLPPLVVKSSTPAAGAQPAGGKVNLRLKPKPRKAHR